VVHVDVIVVHESVYELVLFVALCHFSDAVAVAVLLNLDPVHLHFKGVVDMSDVVPCVFDETRVDEVELFVDVESTVVDPVVIVAVQRQFRSESV
jgi:hypothetical protein